MIPVVRLGRILALGVLLMPLAADAQQPTKIPRIGLLASIRSPAIEGFERGLKELGYVEGQNILIEWRLVEGRFERLPEFAAELVRLKVDVIVAPAPLYVLAAKQATSTIPIVFAVVPDPVASGFVASLARPGGNVTGLSSQHRDLNLKRLQLLKEAVPGLKRVTVLTDPPPAAVATVLQGSLRDIQGTGQSLGLQVQVVSVQGPDQLEGAFSQITKQGARALILVPGSPMFYGQRKKIADLALKRRLSVMAESREYVEAGSLIVYAASYPDLMRRSAGYVHKILKGAKPADLPVEQAERFELVINLKTAKALGVTIPRQVLLRADEIIQ